MYSISYIIVFIGKDFVELEGHTWRFEERDCNCWYLISSVQWRAGVQNNFAIILSKLESQPMDKIVKWVMVF